MKQMRTNQSRTSKGERRKKGGGGRERGRKKRRKGVRKEGGGREGGKEGRKDFLLFCCFWIFIFGLQLAALRGYS